MADHSKKEQANAQFKKLQRSEDGKKALSEYESERIAVRAKTERLRALRLARDAAEHAAALAAPPKAATAKKKKSATAAKKASASLSDWLKNQRASGHNS